MKKVLCVLFCLLLLSTTTLFAGEGSYADGLIAGEAMAKGQGIHYVSGCLLGPIGIIIPYLVSPEIPTAMIMGKSGEYILGFQEGYTKKARKLNVRNATVGCVGSSIFSIASYWGLLYLSGLPLM